MLKFISNFNFSRLWAKVGQARAG